MPTNKLWKTLPEMTAQGCVTRAGVDADFVGSALSAQPVIPAIGDARQADTRWRHSDESGICHFVTAWPQTPWVRRLTGKRWQRQLAEAWLQ